MLQPGEMISMYADSIAHARERVREGESIGIVAFGFRIVGRLLAEPQTAARPLRARVRTTAGIWAVLDGGRLQGAAAGGVAVTIRAATGHEVLDVLGRAFGLTARERQLARLVADGLSTQQIAERLYITPARSRTT